MSAPHSHVQNSLLFGTWLLSGKPRVSIRGEKLANVLLLACCYQEVSVRHREGGRSIPSLLC